MTTNKAMFREAKLVVTEAENIEAHPIISSTFFPSLEEKKENSDDLNNAELSVPLSPQELGQEALWVEGSPKKATMGNKQAPTLSSSAQKTRIVLLNTEKEEIPAATKLFIDQRQLAVDQALTARNSLMQALAVGVKEHRLRLAKLAFEHAIEARALMGLVTDTENINQAREQALQAIQSTDVPESYISKCLSILLPSTVFPPATGSYLSAVDCGANKSENQDISTLGFDNTFELPSVKNVNKKDGFDTLSMSSLNEILDGPIDEGPKKTIKHKRFPQFFRSRKKQENKNTKNKKSRGKSNERKHSRNKNKVNSPLNGAPLIKGPSKKASIEKADASLRRKKSRHQEDFQSRSTSKNAKSKHVSELTVGEEAALAALVSLPSVSPSSSGVGLDDKYHICAQEILEGYDKYDVQDESLFGLWNTCGAACDIRPDCGGTRDDETKDRYWGSGDNDSHSDDETEKEKYHVEGDRYGVDDVLPDEITSTPKEEKGKRRGLFWFRKRNGGAGKKSSDVLETTAASSKAISLKTKEKARLVTTGTCSSNSSASVPQMERDAGIVANTNNSSSAKLFIKIPGIKQPIQTNRQSTQQQKTNSIHHSSNDCQSQKDKLKLTVKQSVVPDGDKNTNKYHGARQPSHVPRQSQPQRQKMEPAVDPIVESIKDQYFRQQQQQRLGLEP
jgi:hypothetical protein